MTLTSARTLQYIGIILALGVIGGGYWYYAAYGTVRLQKNPADSLAMGLAAYWKLDDGTGTTATDSSVNGNNGTLTNGPTWGTGNIGGAVNFDGSNDYIDIPSSTPINFGTGDFSVSLWAKFNNFTNNVNGLMNKDSYAGGSTYNGWYINICNACSGQAGLGMGTRNIVSGSGPDTHVRISTSSLSTATWYHLTFTRSSGVLRMYLNGAQVSSATELSSTNVTNTTNARIGSLSSGSTQNFNGSIDEVRMFSRALSDDDVSKLYQLSSSTGVDIALKGYWSFNGQDITGTTAYDRSGKGSNGTLTSGPTRTQGIVGQALSFDGADDVVQLSTSDSANYYFTATQAFTVSMWVKPSMSYSAPYGFLGGVRIPTDGLGWFMYYCHTNRQLCASYYGGTGAGNHERDSSANAVPLGQWTHVVFVRDGTNTMAGTLTYINGVSDTGTALGSGSTGNINYGSSIVSFGKSVQPTANPFMGDIDEARIYTRALSAAEIQTLYKQGQPDALNTSQNSSMTNGLVGEWSFNGADISGTTATDRSGSGNNGTLTNGPTKDIGRVGQSITLDGSDDYVDSGNGSGLQITGSVTLSAWVRWAPSLPGASIFPRVISKLTNSPYNGYEIVLGASNGGSVAGKFYFQVANGGVLQSAYANIALVPGILYHVVATYNGTVGTLYIDGVAQTATFSAASAVGASSANLNIGRWPGLPTNTYWNGSIDEVRVYNRTLSSQEISSLFLIGQPDALNTSQNSSMTNGLVGEWSFNGADISGTTATDRSGSGNNGTLTNGPTKDIGRVGQSLSFDGSDDYVSLVSKAFGNKASGSASVWVKSPNYNGGVVLYEDGSGYNNFAIAWPAASNGVITFNLGSNTGITTSKNDFATNTWYHLVVSWDSTSVKSYVNGALDKTTVSSDHPNTASGLTTQIGRFAYVGNSGGYFTGVIDEVRVYNRALSVSEVTALYNQGK